MSKTLISLLAFTAIVAAAALGLVIYKALQPAEAPGVASGPTPPAAVVDRIETPAPAPATAKRVAPPVQPTPTVVPTPNTPQPEEVVIQGGNAQVGLTMHMNKTTQNLKYRLPSSLMAQRLSGANDPTLRFSQEQVKSVAEIDADMKDQIDQNLAPIWATRNLLRIQMESFARKGEAENLANARRHYNQEFEKETAFRLLLNQEYVKKLGDVLNADQMRYFSGAITPEMQTRLYGAPIEEPAEGFSDNKLTDPVEARLREHEAGGIDKNLP